MSKVSGFWEIIRPLNSIMLGLAIVVSALITGGIDIISQQYELLLSFITGFFLSGASMTINDYFDLEIDRVNEPSRPIPSGRILPIEALVLTVILSLVGLTAAYMVSIQALVISVFAWFVMMLYSAWGKKTGFIGNLMVSSCISLPFIYGGMLSGNIKVTLYFSLLAFMSNTGREVTKGIVDVTGDKKAGVYTVAVTRGEETAAKVGAMFYVASVVSSVLPVILELVSLLYIPFVMITDIGFLYGAYSLVKKPTRENARAVKNKVLYLMFVGLMGFAAGSLY